MMPRLPLPQRQAAHHGPNETLTAPPLTSDLFRSRSCHLRLACLLLFRALALACSYSASVIAERIGTMFMAFPSDLLRFLERLLFRKFTLEDLFEFVHLFS